MAAKVYHVAFKGVAAEASWAPIKEIRVPRLPRVLLYIIRLDNFLFLRKMKLKSQVLSTNINIIKVLLNIKNNFIYHFKFKS